MYFNSCILLLYLCHSPCTLILVSIFSISTILRVLYVENSQPFFFGNRRNRRRLVIAYSWLQICNNFVFFYFPSSPPLEILGGPVGGGYFTFDNNDDLFGMPSTPVRTNTLYPSLLTAKPRTASQCTSLFLVCFLSFTPIKIPLKARKHYSQS